MGKKLNKTIESINTIIDAKIDESLVEMKSAEGHLINVMTWSGSGVTFGQTLAQISSLYEQHLKTCSRIIFDEWLNYIDDKRGKIKGSLIKEIVHAIELHYNEIYKNISGLYNNSIKRFNPRLRALAKSDQNLFRVKVEALDLLGSELKIYLSKQQNYQHWVFDLYSNKYIVGVIISVIGGLILMAIGRALGM